MNRELLEEMLRQTRNALLYADLALFVMDSRDGITQQDVALYNWLNIQKMRLRSDEVELRERSQTNLAEVMDEFTKPALVPSLIDQIAQVKTFDPLERQKMQQSIDIEARKLRREQQL